MNGYPINGFRLTRAEVRAVWAWLSEHPRDTLREIELALGKPKVRIAACLLLLHQRGLIECYPNLARARRIVVPLLVVDGERVRLVRLQATVEQ